MRVGPAPERWEAALGDFSREVEYLAEDDALYLRAAWDGGNPAERTRAWQRAKSAVAVTQRTDVLERLKAELTNWANARFQPRGHMVEPVRMTGGLSHDDVRRDALPPLLDAGVALLVRDALDPDSFEALMAPWHALGLADPQSGSESDQGVG